MKNKFFNSSVLIIFFLFSFFSFFIQKVDARSRITCSVNASVDGNDVTISGHASENGPELDASYTEVYISDSAGAGTSAGTGEEGASVNYTARFPAGSYTAYVSGTGQTNPGGATSTCSSSTNFTVIDVTPVNGQCSSNTQYACNTGRSINNQDYFNRWEWSCEGSNGGSTASCSKNKSLVTVSINSNPGTITQGGSSTLTWSSTGATDCYASGGWSGGKPTSGSATVYPTQTTSYTINCSSSSGGSASDEATVVVASANSSVNGACATTHYNCNAGTAGSTSGSSTGSGSSYTWMCNGLNGGSNASCSETTTNPITPQCSTTHYNCSAGSAGNQAQYSDRYTWSCSSGGSSVDCSEQIGSGTASVQGYKVFNAGPGDMRPFPDGQLIRVNGGSAGTGMFTSSVSNPYGFSLPPGHYQISTETPTGLGVLGYTLCVSNAGPCNHDGTPVKSTYIILDVVAGVSYDLWWHYSSSVVPVGNHDYAGCDYSAGWAVDNDSPDVPVRIQIFDGPAGSGGVLLDDFFASASRPDLVAAGYDANHGYTWPIPASLKNNVPHSLYAYAVDLQDSSSSTLLGSAPKTITCAVPPPTSLVSSCAVNGKSASSAWTLPTGFSLSYFRVQDNNNGTYPAAWIPEQVADTGSATSFATSPGHSYTTWAHTRTPNGQWSNELYSSFVCTIPPPTSITSSCSSTGVANLSWGLPVGYNLSYFRVQDNTAGTYPAAWIPEQVSDTGAATSFIGVPGHSYTAWVHTRTSDGLWSNELYTSFNCPFDNQMVGTLSAPSCTIPRGGNSCNVNLNWTTTNPEAVSRITSAYPAPNTIVAEGNNGGPLSVTIPYNSRTFYLYNNDQVLAPRTAWALCSPVDYWDIVTQTCKQVPVNAFSVDLKVNGKDHGTPAKALSALQGEVAQFSWTALGNASLSCLTENGTVGWAKTFVEAVNANLDFTLPITIGTYQYALRCTNDTALGMNPVEKVLSFLHLVKNALASLDSKSDNVWVKVDLIKCDECEIYTGGVVTLTWQCPVPPSTASEGVNFSTDTDGDGKGNVSGTATVKPIVSTKYSVICNDGSSGSIDITVKKRPIYNER